MKTARAYPADDGGLWLDTPYNPDFVAELKNTVPKWSRRIALCQKSSRPIICAHADDGLSYTVSIRHAGDYGPNDATHLAELFAWATTNPRRNAGNDTNPQCIDYFAADGAQPAQFTIYVDDVPVERMPELYRRAMILLGAAA